MEEEQEDKHTVVPEEDADSDSDSRTDEEQAVAAKQPVYLGFAEPVRDGPNGDVEDSHVGGLPRWIRQDVESANLNCVACGEPAPLLAQIYAPLDWIEAGEPVPLTRHARSLFPLSISPCTLRLVLSQSKLLECKGGVRQGPALPAQGARPSSCTCASVLRLCQAVQ
jgi:hypothetical protein